MKRKILHLAAAATLGCLLTTNTQAGVRTWDFNDWFGPTVTNLTLASTLANPEYAGFGNGNPDGFLQLTKAAGGQNLAVVFPDIDNGAPVKAFIFKADMRVGNGSEAPADGFSVSFVRENDPALSNATRVVVNAGTGWEFLDPPINLLYGFAGGDSLAQAQDPLGANLPENGTKTGVSILFDAWKGNWLPDGQGPPGGNDVVGIGVRVDDKTLLQKGMTEANQPCANTNSMQTGLWTGDSSNAGLEWCKLEVELNTNKQVTVMWKGVKLLDKYQLANYSPHIGRIILAGRTGGNNQNVNFDNVYLETTPAVEATFGTVTVNPNLKGWAFTLTDFSISVVTNISQVLWNGVDVTASVVVSKVGGVTTGTYTQAARLPSGSANSVTVTYKTAINQTLTGIGSAVTPGYYLMPPALAMPLSAVSGQPRGIALGQTWQTTAANPNTLVWTEEQILGLRGTNLITGASPTSTDILDFQNSNLDPAAALNGNFRVNGSTAVPPFWDGADYDIRSLGFVSNPNDVDNGTIEWFAYVSFPAAGSYTMIVNSDDGFQLSTARNSRDRLGSVISSFNGGRGNGTGLGAGTSQQIEVDQAGVYPIRGFIQNGGGGFNVEWYTKAGTNLYLVNSNSTPQALQAYQSATGAGCYVQSAIPVRNAAGVLPTQKIIIHLGNGTTTVNAGSIVLKVDGNTVSPTLAGLHLELAPIGPGGLWVSGSRHTNELTFTDSASVAYSYTWSFTVIGYTALAGGFPLGSEDATKVGFTYSTYQVANGVTGGVQIPNRIHSSEQVLQGMWGVNVATLASGPVTGVINFDNTGASQGNFNTGNGYPESLVPGIPGGSANPTDSYASEILTYVEFPAAGFYGLGFNSDDGFRTTPGFARPAKTGQLTILSPASVAGNKAAVMPSYNGGLDVQTTNDVSAQIVLTSPITADTALANAAQIAGKIALCYRGVNGFADKIQKCAQAGAIGVIIVTSRPEVTPTDGAFPIEAGATLGPVPAVMIFLATGNALTNAMGSGPVMGTLAAMPDPAASLGQADVGRGATDTLYYMQVPAPGLYALRTMWFQGGGGGNCEWFSIKDGVRTLLNDLSNAAALKCYYGLQASVKPTVGITTSGGNVTVSGQGTLQGADKVTGPYVDLYGPNPLVKPATAPERYYRSRQ